MVEAPWHGLQVNARDGTIADTYLLQDDFVHANHNFGIHMWDDLLLVVGVRCLTRRQLGLDLKQCFCKSQPTNIRAMPPDCQWQIPDVRAMPSCCWWQVSAEQCQSHATMLLAGTKAFSMRCDVSMLLRAVCDECRAYMHIRACDGLWLQVEPQMLSMLKLPTSSCFATCCISSAIHAIGMTSTSHRQHD